MKPRLRYRRRDTSLAGALCGITQQFTKDNSRNSKRSGLKQKGIPVPVGAKNRVGLQASGYHIPATETSILLTNVSGYSMYFGVKTPDSNPHNRAP